MRFVVASNMHGLINFFLHIRVPLIISELAMNDSWCGVGEA